MPIFVVTLEVSAGKGTGADDRHVAFEHIEQLRKLIYAEAAEHFTHSCHSRIVLNLEKTATRLIELFHLRHQLVSLMVHRPELQHDERFSVNPNSLLLEQNRPMTRDLDEYGRKKQQWR